MFIFKVKEKQMKNEYIYGMLSDVDIIKYFGKGIDIYTEHENDELKFNLNKQLQLASIDLRFRSDYKRFKNGINSNLNYEMLKNREYTDPFELSNNERLIIDPGEVIFTTTLETVKISSDFAGIITGRSSIARLGIMVHCCQEFINPGQCAPIALQITNLGKYPVELDMTFPICQLILFKLSSPSSKSYAEMDSSKYKNEIEPMQSKIYKDSEKSEEIIPNDNSKDKAKNSKVKKFLKNYISPLLPSIIMLLLITPTLNKIGNITISSFLSGLKDLPIAGILSIIAIVAYIYFRKDDE